MKGRKKVLFSAQRRVVRRRVAVRQRILTVLLLVCGAYLLWYRWDSGETARKNRELQQMAWQNGEEEVEGASGRKKAEEEAESASGRKKAEEEAEGASGREKAEEEAEGAAAREKAEEEAEGASGRENGEEEAESAAAGEGKTDGTVETAFGEMVGFDELLQINADLKGWISIPGTILSLPVVQGKDNDWYLSHDFYGGEDRHGTIFADCGADLAKGEPNTVLYGHHMRDGSMFGILREYRDEGFYREHPSFFLYLPGEEREYEIMAVLRNDIFEGNGESFQYYDYKQIRDGETFEEYCGILAENALYDTGVGAQAGDELVTLCTCDYGSEDQRLLVVGKRKRKTSQ